MLPRSRSCVERVEQPVVVARVQADRRLVEDVEHADQAAADLAGQANALRLAAGERRRGAVEREVVEADVVQEAEPAADFLEHFGGDQLLVAFELQLGEELGRVGHRPARTLRAATAAAGRRTRAGAWSTVTARACGLSRSPCAVGAADDAHVLFELPDLHRALAGAVFVEQLGDDALERAAVFLRRLAVPAR